MSGRLAETMKMAMLAKAAREGGRAVAPAIPTIMPRPRAQWPYFVRVIASRRHVEDTGIGDTIARNLARFGTEGLKRLYRRITGSDCGCNDRRLALNALFPYNL